MDLEGGGSRRPNCDQLLSYSVIISEIPRHYRQDTYKVNGSNCTWLSAAMLIGRYDSEDGRQMSIQLYNDNNVDKFEYMMVSKNSNQQLHDENDKDSVTQPLSYFVEKYGYMLQRVKNKHKCYIQYLLDETTKGKYICVLTTHSNEKTHVMGIDCDKKELCDCMEKYYLKLSKASLDYCCGSNNFGLREITTCRKITQQQRSQKKKSI